MKLTFKQFLKEARYTNSQHYRGLDQSITKWLTEEEWNKLSSPQKSIVSQYGHDFWDAAEWTGDQMTEDDSWYDVGVELMFEYLSDETGIPIEVPEELLLSLIFTVIDAFMFRLD